LKRYPKVLPFEFVLFLQILPLTIAKKDFSKTNTKTNKTQPKQSKKKKKDLGKMCQGNVSISLMCFFLSF